MKVLIVIMLLLLAGSIELFAQGNGQYYQYNQPNEQNNQYNQQLYIRKVRSYTRMRNWGLGLLVGGGLAFTGGVLLVASNPPVTNTSYYNNGYYSNTPTYDPAGYTTGIAFIELGIVGVIPGIIFTAVGLRKTNYYKSKLSGLSFGMAPRGKGLSLTYTF